MDKEYRTGEIRGEYREGNKVKLKIVFMDPCCPVDFPFLMTVALAMGLTNFDLL